MSERRGIRNTMNRLIGAGRNPAVREFLVSEATNAGVSMMSGATQAIRTFTPLAGTLQSHVEVIPRETRQPVYSHGESPFELSAVNQGLNQQAMVAQSEMGGYIGQLIPGQEGITRGPAQERGGGQNLMFGPNPQSQFPAQELRQNLEKRLRSVESGLSSSLGIQKQNYSKGTGKTGTIISVVSRDIPQMDDQVIVGKAENLQNLDTSQFSRMYISAPPPNITTIIEEHKLRMMYIRSLITCDGRDHKNISFIMPADNTGELLHYCQVTYQSFLAYIQEQSTEIKQITVIVPDEEVQKLFGMVMKGSSINITGKKEAEERRKVLETECCRSSNKVKISKNLSVGTWVKDWGPNPMAITKQIEQLNKQAEDKRKELKKERKEKRREEKRRPAARENSDGNARDLSEAGSSLGVLRGAQRDTSIMEESSHGNVRRSRSIGSLGSVDDILRRALGDEPEIMETESGRQSRQSKRNLVLVESSDDDESSIRVPPKRPRSQDVNALIPLRPVSPQLSRFSQSDNTRQRVGLANIINKEYIDETKKIKSTGPIDTGKLAKYSGEHKDSNAGICLFCNAACSNLQQHLSNQHIFDGLAAEEKEQLAKDLHHNMNLSRSYLERRHTAACFQEKSEWSKRMVNLAPSDQNALIELAENAGIIFLPKNISLLDDWEQREQWRVAVPGSPERSVEPMEDRAGRAGAVPESYIGDLSWDKVGYFEEVSLGAADQATRSIAKGRGLDRQLIISQHSLLQRTYNHIVRMAKANPRTLSKSQDAERYATTITNAGAKWLLVAMRLNGEYRTIQCVNDIPSVYFVKALEAYAHAHLEVFASGAVLNFLKNSNKFLQYVGAVDTINTSRPEWVRNFEVAQKRISFLKTCANQIAVSHQAMGRAARNILPYGDLCTKLEPIENWLGEFYETWKSKSDQAIKEELEPVIWNALGSFLIVMVILENGQRAEVAYKWRIQDFKAGVPYQEGGSNDFCFMYPFPTSKTSRSNIKLATSKQLRDWLVLYNRIRTLTFPEEKKNGSMKFFRLANGGDIKSPLALARSSERFVLDSNLLKDFQLVHIRNSATNTYAGAFIRLDPNNLNPDLFPAQGAMNHQLRTHIKIYATDASAIVYRAWVHLQRSRKNSNYQRTSDELREEIRKLSEMLVCMEAQENDSHCKASVYSVDDLINEMADIQHDLETVLNVSGEWQLKIAKTKTLPDAIADALNIGFNIPLEDVNSKMNLVFSEVVDFQAQLVSSDCRDNASASLLRQAKIGLEYLGYRYVILVTKDHVKDTSSDNYNISEVHLGGVDMDQLVEGEKPIFLLLEDRQRPKWRSIRVTGGQRSLEISTNEDRPTMNPVFAVGDSTKVFYQKRQSHLMAIMDTRTYLTSRDDMEKFLAEHQDVMAETIQARFEDQLNSMIDDFDGNIHPPDRPPSSMDAEDYYTPHGSRQDLTQQEFNYSPIRDFHRDDEQVENLMGRLQMVSPLPGEARGSQTPVRESSEMAGFRGASVDYQMEDYANISQPSQSYLDRPSTSHQTFDPSFASVDPSDLSSLPATSPAEELRREDRRSLKAGKKGPLFSQSDLIPYIDARNRATDLLRTSADRITEVHLESVPEKVKEAADSMSLENSVRLAQWATNYWPVCSVFDERCRNQEMVGRGVRAAMDVEKEAVLTDYSGLWMKKNAFDGTEEYDVSKQYVIEIHGKREAIFGHRHAVIQGGGRPFYGPLLNHSPVHANCAIKLDKKLLPDQPLVFIHALRDIKAGEELLWTYAQSNTSSMPFLKDCPCVRCLGRCHCKACDGIHFHMSQEDIQHLENKQVAEGERQEVFDREKMLAIFTRETTGAMTIREMVYERKAGESGQIDKKFFIRFLQCQGWTREEEKNQTKNKVKREKILECLNKWIEDESIANYKQLNSAVEALKWTLPSGKDKLTFASDIQKAIGKLSVKQKPKALAPFMKNAVIFGRAKDNHNVYMATGLRKECKGEKEIQLMALLVVEDEAADTYGFVPRELNNGGYDFDKRIDKPLQSKITYVDNVKLSR